MNKHNPPDDRAVKNVYSATITRLRAEISDLKDTREGLLSQLRLMIQASDWPGQKRDAVKQTAIRLADIVTEEMETE